ncbi:CHAT domain-containing protein [Sanguibacter sp. 25GB23B1]|uniref:CHAT domain-containing protein n=1 Tax=unclassified Sanguibacter TaxID=2645534 RepID=UPI0032AF4DB9
MFVTTITVDAHQTMSDAAERTSGIPDAGYVVVRRREGLDLYFYAYRAGFLREMAGVSGAGRVVDVLNLHEGMASPTAQVDAPPTADVGLTIVLDGDSAVGLILENATSDRGTGIDVRPISPPTARPSHPAVPGLHVNEGWIRDEQTVWGGGVSAGDSRVPDLTERVSPTPELGPEPEPEPEPTMHFTAHPRLDCPAVVSVGEPLDLTVGLSAQEVRGTVGGMVSVETDLAELDLVVTVVASGFTAQRTRDVLHVDRSNLSANAVTFALTAEPIEGALQPATLQVDFSYGGVLCGRSWRAVVVTAEPSPLSPHGAPSPVVHREMPSTSVLVTESDRPPDLVITISENDDGTQLEWQFTTRHAGVHLPAGMVRSRFQKHNAKTFAMQQIRLIHESIGSTAVATRVVGAARTIADEVPPEAWRVLAEVWSRTATEDRRPSVLLVSTDAYIPWELSSTEVQYVGAGVMDSSVPPFLGAQTCISRWNAPQARGAGGVLNPPLPPPESHDIRTMVLVIGDYLATNGVRPLPKATEEGNELAALYRAVRLSAEVGEIEPLFNGVLVRDGMQVDPDLVHFACHGQIDPNPGFNGIVLNEGNARLDALYVAGSRMLRPFVFVNACQVGQTTELLDDAGGLATSFLKTGARGFVAPLWNVDDQIAKDTALGFYDAALRQRTPVAEVLRRRRAMFDPGATKPEPTHLAYIYYGHPNLVLAHAR